MIKCRELKKMDLAELKDFWNRNVANDPVTVALLHEKIFDDPEYFAPMVWVATDENKIVAFMQGVERTDNNEKKGWIKLFATEKAYRRQGLATKLLKKIERQMIERGVQKLRMLDCAPNYLQPGIDPFYTEAIAFVIRHGFQKVGDTSNLKVDLVNQDFNTAAEEKAALERGILLRRAKLADEPILKDFLNFYFKNWLPEVPVMLRNNPVSLHLGFQRDELVAFAGHNGNNFNTGWFGPMGTNPNKRGLGIGGILLKRCLQDMKEQGLKYSIIPWVGPIQFYMHHVNSPVCRVFWSFEKELIKL